MAPGVVCVCVDISFPKAIRAKSGTLRGLYCIGFNFFHSKKGTLFCLKPGYIKGWGWGVGCGGLFLEKKGKKKTSPGRFCVIFLPFFFSSILFLFSSSLFIFVEVF